MSIPTPHISAKKGDFAKTVLMPGDPLRAKFIADTFLEDAKLVTSVRAVYGYTGLYKGKKVSVMASGMGMPSMGIYAYELYNFYDVDNIIRIGSAGAINKSLKLKDIILAIGACTNSNFANQYRLPGVFAPTASFDILQEAVKKAKELKIKTVVGNVLTSDLFYDDAKSANEWEKMGVLATEMECAALYLTAARCGKKALGMVSVVDFMFSNESMTSDERQLSLTQMLTLALETAILL